MVRRLVCCLGLGFQGRRDGLHPTRGLSGKRFPVLRPHRPLPQPYLGARNGERRQAPQAPQKAGHLQLISQMSRAPIGSRSQYSRPATK